MLYEPWCDMESTGDNQKQLWKLTERAGGRVAIAADLPDCIRSHYDDMERIAEEIRELGYPHAAAILAELQPGRPRQIASAMCFSPCLVMLRLSRFTTTYTYRDALGLIHESGEQMPFSEGAVLQLHGILYRYGDEEEHAQLERRQDQARGLRARTCSDCCKPVRGQQG